MANDALNRPAHWLAAHAPRMLPESLNPGAAEAQLAAVEVTPRRSVRSAYLAPAAEIDLCNWPTAARWAALAF